MMILNFDVFFDFDVDCENSIIMVRWEFVVKC